MKPVYVSLVSEPYWLAIPEDERAAIAAAVPDGHQLYIAPGYRAKPGTVDVSLRDARNYNVRGPSRGYLTAQRCWVVLSPARRLLPRVVVTTDGGGWIESIEDA